jgi:hypothetical protein
MRRTFWLNGVGGVVLMLGLLLPGAAEAADRSNLSLQSRGGGSVYRSWVYDGLERLVLAGLVDQAVLNTKPLSRVEAARIVARAIDRIRRDQSGDFNDRGEIEDLLDRLIEEFRTELTDLGVKGPTLGAPSSFLTGRPLASVQLQPGYANNRYSLLNSQGRSLEEGFNKRISTEHRAQVGDFLTLYLNPEFHGNEEFARFRLQTGYAKLTLWNVELMAGRESLWWGPGYRGSMLLSNNAQPLDQIRLGTAEPVRLPWLLEYLGPLKAMFFVAWLTENRDHPDPYLTGIRFNIAPSKYLELGLGRVIQFAGKGRGTTVGDFPGIFFDDGSDDPGSAVDANNLLAFDAALRVPNAGRYIFVARDLMLYGEMGWDDTVTGVIVPDKPGFLAGTLLSGLLGSPDTDLRLEYAQTSTISYTHHIYTTGYQYRGNVLSHFIGADGWDFYSRLIHRFTPDLTAGLELERASIGSVASGGVNKPREKRINFGVDLSYGLTKSLSAFGAYTFSDVNNRDFVSGADGRDHILRLELTHSF